MISKKALEKGGKEVAFHPVGTGPFIFEEWKPTDYMKVKKNPNYWRKGYPKVDSIKWIPVVDNNTRAAMLQTGEADFCFPTSRPRCWKASPGSTSLHLPPSFIAGSR